VKINDIDDPVYGVCRDWYDRSATPQMYAVAYRSTAFKESDIDAQALLAEIEKCRTECREDKEISKLDHAISIIRHCIERDEVLLQIAALVGRAKKAGLNQDEFVTKAASAWEFEG
jgi:hypothetical protein